jgi:hypothetical protein
MTVILPTPHEPLVEKDGKINEIWYRYLSENAIETNASISGRAKAWGVITSAATTAPVFSTSYNTASVAGDSTTFTVTVTLVDPFASTNYAVSAMPQVAAFTTAASPIAVLTGKTSIAFSMQSTGYTAISFACYGDQ